MPFDLVRRTHRGRSIALAERTLPVLVYYATVLRRGLSYSELAAIIGTHYRVLGRPLWYIGQELEALRQRSRKKIPFIQFLVGGKYSGIPGDSGLDWLLEDIHSEKGRLKLTRQEREAATETVRNTIINFPDWEGVLRELKLPRYKPPTPNLQDVAQQVAHRYNGHGTGESRAHLRLKYFISENPNKIGLRAPVALESVEYIYPSADRADILFLQDNCHVAVEVKPKGADETEIARGVYQCVKYNALSQALLVGNGEQPHVRSILALGGRFPSSLNYLRKALRLEVRDNVEVPDSYKLPKGVKPCSGDPDERD